MAGENCEVQYYNESQPDANETTKTIAYSTFSLVLCYVIVSIFLFIRLQERYARLKVRQCWSIAIIGLGTIDCAALVCLREAIGRENFPCDAFTWTSLLLLPFWGIPMYGRLSRYRHVLKWNLEKRVVQVPDVPSGAPLTELSTTSSVQEELSQTNPLQNSVSEDMKYLLALQYKASWTRIVLLLIAISIPITMIVVIGSLLGESTGQGCVGCTLSPVVKYIAIVQFLLFISLLGWKFYKARRKQQYDYHGVFAETKLVTAILIVSGALSVILDYEDPGQLSANGSVSWGYFLVFGTLLSYSILGPYQIAAALRSDNFFSANCVGLGCERSCFSGDGNTTPGASKYSTTSMTSEEPRTSSSFFGSFKANRARKKQFDSLREVLRTKIGIDAFSMHLAAELCTEDIRFWLEANIWKSNYYSGISPQDRQKKAEAIFATFLSPRAVMRVSVSKEVLQDMRKYFGLKRLGVTDRKTPKHRNRKQGKRKTVNTSTRNLLPVIQSSGLSTASSNASARNSKLLKAMEQVAAEQAEQEMLPAAADVFDAACAEVFENMEKRHFVSFKKSLYFRSMVDGSLYERFGIRLPDPPNVRTMINDVV